MLEGNFLLQSYHNLYEFKILMINLPKGQVFSRKYSIILNEVFKEWKNLEEKNLW